MKFISLFNPLLGVSIAFRNRELLLRFISRNILSRYKGAWFGILWSLLYPLLMLLIFTFVFSVIFTIRWSGAAGAVADNRMLFAITIFCGMAVINIFSETLGGAVSLISGNPNYVKKVVFPLEILPISLAVGNLVFGLVWFALLAFGAIFILGTASWTMLLLPLTLVPLFLLSCGFAFWFSSLGVYVRDLQYLVGVLVQMLYFLTPIFYPIGAVPPEFRPLLELNPLSLAVEQTRRIIVYGSTPEWGTCALLWLGGIIVFQLGLVWFIKTKRGFADVL